MACGTQCPWPDVSTWTAAFQGSDRSEVRRGRAGPRPRPAPNSTRCRVPTSPNPIARYSARAAALPARTSRWATRAPCRAAIPSARVSSRRASPRRRASGATARLWTCDLVRDDLEGAVGADPALVVRAAPRARAAPGPPPAPPPERSRRAGPRSDQGWVWQRRSSATSAREVVRRRRLEPSAGRGHRAGVAAPCPRRYSGRSSAGATPPPAASTGSASSPSVPARKALRAGKPRVRHRGPDLLAVALGAVADERRARRQPGERLRRSGGHGLAAPPAVGLEDTRVDLARGRRPSPRPASARPRRSAPPARPACRARGTDGRWPGPGPGRS